MPTALLIPGMREGATSNYYDRLEKSLAQEKITLIRKDYWTMPEELQHQTLQTLHQEINQTIKEKNVTILIAKSFGGMLALTLQNPTIKKMVLWAPVIGLGKDTIIINRNKPLGSIETLHDIKIGGSRLRQEPPTLILQGDEDVNVREEHNYQLSLQMNQGHESYKIIPGTDHAFTGKMDEIIEATINFLKKS